MRTYLLAGLFTTLAIGCGPNNRGDSVDATTVEADSCVGIECMIVNCAKLGKPPTTLSGTVFAPNGTLAVFGAQVYIPLLDPGPFPEGVQCSQCTSSLPGGAAAHAISDEAGKFTLSNVPSGTDVPLFVTVGKWRRKVTIPKVEACQDNPLPPEITSLPKNKSEGDLPKIAIATGSCDALECLVRKLGVSDSEFTDPTKDGSVHLYTMNGAATNMQGTAFPPAATLWDNLDQLKKYDLAMFSCECGQEAAAKSQDAMNNMKAYADLGGRVFLSHYQNVWIAGDVANPTHAPPVWPQIATCDSDEFLTGSDMIDTVNNPKGAAFQNWMMNVQGSTTPGVIPIQDGRQTCTTIDHEKAERWVYLPGGTEYPQNFQFTTPNEVEEGARCGKVVFSDMHVASGSSSSSPFPSGCSAAPMSPQEKALSFMFFDIATCVGPIF
ncbi:MAG: carboxypeptidase-like regulatory domain-containing protein [Kofleriaceae bacterium]